MPIYKDVRELTNEQLKTDGITGIDVITGGFPCTQTSVAAAITGNRYGLKGKDSGLWYEYFRIVLFVRPVWVIIENPGGIKKWEGEIKDSLEGAGYRVSRLEFEAADFGLPHARRRYFYVANANGQRLAVTRPKRSPSIEWVKRLTSAGGNWLKRTPGIVGEFTGLPNRVDRIKALGNTVIPHKVELIGRAMIEHANSPANNIQTKTA